MSEANLLRIIQTKGLILIGNLARIHGEIYEIYRLEVKIGQ